MGLFSRGQHRGQKASNYSGGAPAYEGRHVEGDRFNHDHRICGCGSCPAGSDPGRHCKEHGNGCHVGC